MLYTACSSSDIRLSVQLSYWATLFAAINAVNSLSTCCGFTPSFSQVYITDAGIVDSVLFEDRNYFARKMASSVSNPTLLMLIGGTTGATQPMKIRNQSRVQ